VEILHKTTTAHRQIHQHRQGSENHKQLRVQKLRPVSPVLEVSCSVVFL
jgi:hypothetical protein